MRTSLFSVFLSLSLYFSGLDVDEERKPKMGAKKLLAETDQVVLVRREMESKRTGWSRSQEREWKRERERERDREKQGTWNSIVSRKALRICSHPQCLPFASFSPARVLHNSQVGWSCWWGRWHGVWFNSKCWNDEKNCSVLSQILLFSHLQSSSRWKSGAYTRSKKRSLLRLRSTARTEAAKRYREPDGMTVRALLVEGRQRSTFCLQRHQRGLVIRVVW